MADSSKSQLQLELVNAESKHDELKQQRSHIHSALRRHKADRDRLKSTPQSGSDYDKYSKVLELEGTIAELEQRRTGVDEELAKSLEAIQLLKYRITTHK